MTTEVPVGRRRWAVLAALMLSLVVVVLDNSILNVALTALAAPAPAGLGATQGELEWAINSYTLVVAGLLFSAGLLGDRFGRKKALLAGMLVFGVGSALAAVASSPGQLVAFRAVMGLGAALVMPSTLAVLMNVFEPEEQPKAIGIWAGGIGLAIAAGPLIGGALLARFWWGSVFLVNVPVVLLALVLMALWVPDSRDPHPGRFDPLGTLLCVLGLGLVVYGIIEGGRLADFTGPAVLATVLGGLAVLAVFVVQQRRSDHPSLDIRYFADRVFAASVAALALVMFALLGVTFFTVFYLQSVRGRTPLETGLLLLPLACAQLAFSPGARLAVDRYGNRAVCATGLLVIAATLAAFATFGARTPYWRIEVAFFLMGTGMAHLMTPVSVLVMQSLPREKAGSASALSSTFRQIGGALGVAVLGSVLSTAYRGGMADELGALPPEVRHRAGESVAATLALADQLGPPGRELVAPAHAAFLDAMHLTALCGAAAAVLGALVVAAFLPGRSSRARHRARREVPRAGRHRCAGSVTGPPAPGTGRTDRTSLAPYGRPGRQKAHRPSPRVFPGGDGGHGRR